MNSTDSSRTVEDIRKKTTLKQKFVKFLFKKVPKRLKRIVFISSIMGMIEQSPDADMELVNKLNDVFKLAKDPKTFMLPVHFNSVIWTDVEPNCTLTETNGTICKVCLQDINDRILSHEECEAIGRHFAKNVPDWLKYGSIELMANDVIRLIKEIGSYKINLRGKTSIH